MVKGMMTMLGRLVTNSATAAAMANRFMVIAAWSVGAFFCALLSTQLDAAALAIGGDVAWSYNAAIVGKQEARAMTVDAAGNVILAGYQEAASSDYYTAKVLYNGSGLAWPAVTYDLAGAQDLATAVAVDGQDNIIVTGYAHNGSDYDILTIKYSGDDGSVIWQHLFDGTGSGNDFATALAVDALNNVYVGGTMQDESGRDDFVVIKYVPDGPNPDDTPTWSVAYDGLASGHDRLTAITVGSDGIAATGESQNDAGDFDYVVVKFGLDAHLAWEERYSDAGNGKGLDVALDVHGNVIATGYVDDGVDRDHYTAKYPASGGAPLWVKVRDRGYDDEGRRLWLDASGNVYVTGMSFALTSDKDLTVTRYAAADGADTAPSGWHVDYNTANGNSDVGLAIIGDDAGDVYVTSITNDNVGGFDDIHTYKFCREHGTLLWPAIYGTTADHDRPVGIGLTPDGDPVVAGWSDSTTSDYDYIAIKYSAGALDAPTALAATTVSTTEIALSWQDNSDNEDYFVIERRNGSAEWQVVVSDLAGDSTSFNDTGLTPDHRYYYRVKAINAADGSSPWSNEANARTTIINYDDPTWQHIYAGLDGGDDEPSAIAVGPDNNPVVTGFSFELEGGYDYYTVKLDENADELWSARYNDGDNESDFARAVAVDSSNRAVVSGFASLYAPGGDSNTNDIYTIGYPADSGTPVWAHQYNGPAGDDDRSAAVATAVDGSDDVVVVGYGKNARPDDDIYVIKYSADGNPQIPLWAATPYDGGGVDIPADVAYDPFGDIFVVGKTWNGTDFDYFVAKYDGSDGSMAWGGVPRTYDGAGHSTDYATSLAVDTLGNLYVTGYSVGSGATGDIVTVKYDGATGDIIPGWPKSYDGGGYDTGVAVAIDIVNNDVVIAGTTYVGPGNHDAMVVRYNTAGDELWSKTLDFAGSDEAAAAMAIDRTGVACVVAATDNGSGDDIVAVMFDHNGLTVGANVLDGASGGIDYPVDVVFNAYGEAFVAGVTTNASNNTDYIVFKTISTVAQAPSPVTATLLYTEAELTWADNSHDENGFRIEIKPAACSSTGEWSYVDKAAADTTSYLVSGLNPGSPYCLRVRSENELGETSRWTEVDVVTVEEEPPDGLTATPLNTTEIQLEWNDNTIGETGFELMRCSGAGCDFSSSTLIPVAPDSTRYVDDDVCAGQTYRYRINAYKTGQWVSETSLPTPDVTTPSMQAPSGLSTDWVSEEWVELRWTDNSADASDFSIERCAGSGCTEFALLESLVNPADDVLHLRMDESSWPATADAVTDLSGTGHNATAYGGVTTTADGKYAYAGDFDGSNDYLSTGLVLDQTVETSPGASFAAWVYPASTSAGHHFVIGTDNGGNDWSLSRSAGTWHVANGVDDAPVDTGVAVDAGIWQHLVVVFDPLTGVTLYKNGVSVWSDPGIAFDASTAAVHVGRRGSLNQEFFDGRLDEVAVFIRPLDAIEAQALHDHGLARFNDRTVSYDTTYRYRVRADKAANCAWTSAPSLPVEVVTTPPPPTAFSVTTVDSGRTLLTWADNTTSETGYLIERCTGSGCSDFIEVTTTAADVTSYMDSGLCADPDNESVYTYRLTAVKGTDWASAPAGPDAATIPAVLMPAGLTAVDPSEDRIPLTWSYASTDLTDMQLARCDGDDVYCSDAGNFGTPVSVSPVPAGNLMMLHMDEAYWDGTAGEIADSSGNGNHGTTVNDTRSIAGGKYIRGGWFDGTDDYITTPLNIDQSASGAATFEAWVYPNLNTNSYKFVMSTDNGGADWGLALYGSIWRVANGASTYSTGQSVSFNTWQHMVATFEPGVGVKLYRNGALVWSYASISTDTSDANLIIGRQGNYGQNYFSGRIDEVAVYGRVLSAAEVADRYARSYRLTQTGLPHSSPYTYKLWAEKSTGCPWASNPVILNSATLVPPPPGDLSVVASQTTRIDLAWSDQATSETGYRIERCAGSGSDCDEDAEFTFLSDLAADSTAYSDSTVCYNSTHTYRVRTEKADGPVWQSVWATGFDTTPGIADPANFNATGISESEIALAWDDTTYDEDTFTIERCTGSGTACDEDTEFTATVATVPGTVAGRQLHYRMDEEAWSAEAGQVLDSSGHDRHGQAYSGLSTGLDGRYARAGYFDGSNDFIVSPLNVDQTWSGPGATFEAWVYPTVQDTSYRYVFSTENGGSDWGLYAYNGVWYIATGENLRSTGVPVGLNQWQHVAVTFAPEGGGIRFYKDGSETVLSASYIGYDSSTNNVNIGRRANGSYYFMGRIDEFAVYDHPLSLADVQYHYQRQIQVFTQTDTGLTPGTTYTYRVRASRDADCGWSTSAMTTGTTQDPPAPSALAASVIDTTRIDLAWVDNSGSETAYILQRCEGGGCSDFVNLDVPLPADTTTYSDTTVCPGQAYRYRVRAEKDDGPIWSTIWTGPVEATTATPVDPVELVATRVSEDRIDLAWSDSNQDETGFMVERCAGSDCSDFLPVATVAARDTGSNLMTGANGAVGSFSANVVDLVHPRTGMPVKALQLSHPGPSAFENVPISQSATLNLQADVSYLATFDAWTDAGEAVTLQNDLFPDTLPEVSQSVGPDAKTYRAVFTSSHTDMASAVLRFFHYNPGRTIYVTNINLRRLTYTASYSDAETGLAPDTTYRYRVRSVKDAGCGWQSGYTNIAAAATTLVGPSLLAAAPVNTTRIDLTWSRNTTTDTGTEIWRCQGTGCSDFARIEELPAGADSYSDLDVANGTSYAYRVKARNEGLSGSGGGVWTRRTPVVFTAFRADQNYEIVVPYDDDMRSDFSDVRIYDEIAKRELPCSVVSKVDGVTATIWFRARANDSVSLYYGNPNAVDSGDVGMLDDEYTFSGTEIDNNLWTEIDPSGGISQNDDLLLNDVTQAWTMALISNATYDRRAGRTLYVDLTIPADTVGNNHFMAGWELDQTASAHYNQLVHGFYWNNYAFGTYEKGGSQGGTGTYAASTAYRMKVVLKTAGADYFVQGGDYPDWTLVNQTTNYSDPTLRIAFHQYSHAARIHKVTVSPGSVASGASLGAEQSSAAYLFANTWASDLSNIATATTPPPDPPTGLTVLATSDTDVDLAWSDNGEDETGFEVERCTGEGCTDFSYIAETPADVSAYSDSGRAPSTFYRYRVRAYKTAVHPWVSAYSVEVGDRTFSATASGLSATALNSRMIRLDWEDLASDEQGYEIEVKVWNGHYIKTGQVDADVTSYVDTVGIDEQQTYTYRVRPFRGLDKSPYSNEASVLTPSYELGDGTCAP